MEINEIKKALYKQKPNAEKIGVQMKYGKVVTYFYISEIVLNDETKKLNFSVPVDDMGDATFGDEIKAQLLIRWLA